MGDEGNEKNPVRSEEFQITLYSETLNADELRKVLDNWVKEYEGRLTKDTQKHLKFYLYAPSGDVTEDYYDPTRHYSEFRFESGKTFDNVFYSQKEDIVKRLDFFTNNKEWYKQRGIPYTMGFMFYGEPGCGKTSTIKAIANHTQRHIVSVPLNKIKTAKELLNVFYNTRMNYVDIPLNKRLYVLEDIDAADLKDTVGERSMKDDNENEKKDNNDSGRESPSLDMNMNLFGIIEMYKHYFESDPPVDVPLENLPDLKWTPAEVTQVFLNHMHHPEAALHQLISAESLDNVHLKSDPVTTL